MTSALPFAPSKIDNSLFVYIGPLKIAAYIAIHVDDLLINFPNNEPGRALWEKTRDALTDRFGGLTVDNPATGFTGMEICGSPDGLIIKQSGKINNLPVEGTAKTPSALNILVETPKTDGIETDRTLETRFRSLLGSCLFIGKTRPELSLCLSYLSRKANNPSELHFSQLTRLAQYLRGTAASGLRFDRGNFQTDVQLSADCDASHMVHADLRGQGGWTIRIGARTNGHWPY